MPPRPDADLEERVRALEIAQAARDERDKHIEDVLERLDKAVSSDGLIKAVDGMVSFLKPLGLNTDDASKKIGNRVMRLEWTLGAVLVLATPVSIWAVIQLLAVISGWVTHSIQPPGASP